MQYFRRKLPNSVTKSDLLNGVSGIDKRRLEAAMETLIESDRVVVDESAPPNHPGRKATRYKIRDALRELTRA
jgi:hypothetical protein